MTALTASERTARNLRSVEDAAPARGRTELFRLGAIAAIATVALIPIQMGVFVIWPTPSSAESAFARFRESALAGLLSFDLLLMASWTFSLCVVLALAMALWERGRARVMFAVVFEAAAFAMYFSSNTAFSLLTLSDHYTGAPSEAARASALAAGDAMMALYTGTAFDVSYVLSGAAVLLLGLVVRNDSRFARATGPLMIAYGVMQVPTTAGALGMGLGILSLLPMVAWLVLVARGLLKSARLSEQLE